MSRPHGHRNAHTRWSPPRSWEEYATLCWQWMYIIHTTQRPGLLTYIPTQRAVHALHDIVLESAVRVGLPVMSISASSSALCSNGALVSLAHQQIELALSHNLIPLVHGDVAFDSERGGTVISTEEIFSFLATKLSPSLVLLAGIEEGVLTRWPDGDVIAQLPREGSAGTVSDL